MEYTVKLTPLDLRHQEFSGALSGYQRRQVREFLERASEELEDSLRERRSLEERLSELEKRLDEYRASEDELRRTVVAAERIGNELKQNAQREADLLLREATDRADGLSSETEARRQALEAGHQARAAELEARHRERMLALEAQFQQRHHELDRGLALRMADAEARFNARHNEWLSALSRVRAEYAQFLSQHRALVQGYMELAQRHPLPEEALPDEAPLGRGLNEMGSLLLGDAPLPPIQAEASADAEPPRVEEQQFV